MPPFAAALGPRETDLAALGAAVPALHAWYQASARDLPWRRTRDPYAVWVSEAMLQQTRVTTVIPYYERWMAVFPTIGALALADEGHVLKLWEGLGYYSRARSLHRSIQQVYKNFGGRVPSDPSLFRSLPGVGTYTAAAVLSIAFGADLPVVDGNVIRVLTRLAALQADPRRAATARALEELAHTLLPAGTAALHNQAMMELGALTCTPRSPDCPACPLSAPCRAARRGNPEAYPLRREKPPVPHHDVALGIVFDGGRVLIDQRPYGGLLGGLWEFPGGKVEEGESPADALVRELREELGLEVSVDQPLPPVDHAYTHLKVTLHPFLCRLVTLEPRVGEGRPHRWIAPEELTDYAMPRANRKVIEELKAASQPRAAHRTPKGRKS